jgi:hypothetical protein
VKDWPTKLFALGKRVAKCKEKARYGEVLFVLMHALGCVLTVQLSVSDRAFLCTSPITSVSMLVGHFKKPP